MKKISHSFILANNFSVFFLFFILSKFFPRKKIIKKKNKTRRTRNRQNNTMRKRQKSKKSQRRRNNNNHQSSTLSNRMNWDHSSTIRIQQTLRNNKLTGKNHPNIDDNDDDYSDEDDNINYNDGQQQQQRYDDMIETSETINSHQNHNSLIPSSTGRHRNHQQQQQPSSRNDNDKLPKKSTKSRKPIGIAGATLMHHQHQSTKASLSTIPKTSFECGDKRSDGVYADEETGCQVWHICQNGQMHSFLCPIGTVFNSKNGVCDWWYNVAC